MVFDLTGIAESGPHLNDWGYKLYKSGAKSITVTGDEPKSFLFLNVKRVKFFLFFLN